MPKIPGVNHLQAVKALPKVGFRVLRQGKHIIMTDGIRISDDPAQQPGKRNNNGRERSRCRVDGRAIQGAPIKPESSLASLCLSLNLGSTVPWDDVNR